ncbi:hypothetical protein HBH99_256730, partial [Parastagonospora nodorum]
DDNSQVATRKRTDDNGKYEWDDHQSDEELQQAPTDSGSDNEPEHAPDTDDNESDTEHTPKKGLNTNERLDPSTGSIVSKKGYWPAQASKVSLVPKQK